MQLIEAKGGGIELITSASGFWPMEGKIKGEDRAAADLALDVDRTAVQFECLPDDRETKSGMAVRPAAAGAVIAIKYAQQVRCGDAGVWNRMALSGFRASPTGSGPGRAVRTGRTGH